MDLKQIQGIIKDFEKSNITSLEIELDGFKIKLNKNNNNVETSEVVEKRVVKATPTQVKEETETAEVVNGFEVKSPLVGTFYASSNPKDAPFVSIGQRVEKGQTLCIIEAMKIMNEITAPTSGVIEAIKIKNGEPVGFDQIIMSIV